MLPTVVLVSVGLALAVASTRAAVTGWFAIGGTAMMLLKIWWFWHGRHDFAELVRAGATDPAQPSALRRFAAVGLPWFLIGTAVLIWVVGNIAAVAPDGARWASAAGITQVLVILVPIAAAGTAALARALLEHAPGLATGQPLVRALTTVTSVSASGAVWIVGLYGLAQLWGGFLLDPNTSGVVALVGSIATVSAIALGGWIALMFLRALFETHAPRPGKGMPGDTDEEAATPVQSRLATVLPLIRGFALGGVIGVTVLIALSMLGVDIGPLLAGFGILGLAISFGSQALVRDIVSGIFFMSDDAFRVGEYIDTGRLKGTVEKITLRSVQLRHQSGQIHTIPFGQIQSITNASRDWSTVKFNIRLDRAVDLEKARKIIKKIGQDMLADPEMAAEIIEPLKMQGVADIADAALVCRLKFTAKPARTSWLQREALKRVYKALGTAGIEFASNAVTVRGSNGDTRASAAASTTAAPLVPQPA